VPDNRPAWGGMACLANFGLAQGDGRQQAEALGELKLQVGSDGAPPGCSLLAIGCHRTRIGW
jgi:hypothetical protein